MSLTTRVRFLEPVDPREVWSRVLEHIDPPVDYRWSHVPVGGNPIASCNPLIFAESGQGALAWVYVMYGPDGCRIVEDEDWQESDNIPPAFVELSIISSWESEVLHNEIVVKMSQWQPIAWRDDYQDWQGE